MLESLPHPLSPAVWTTVVADRDPSAHGIRDFLILRRGAQGGRMMELATSNDRLSLALWNLLGPFGRSVSFAGWWATWPAEGPEPTPETVDIGQPGQHNRQGILIAAGGPIRKGAAVQASVLGVAPTILALPGLPVPEDMQGRVLKEILDPEFLARHPVGKIRSYEERISRQPVSTVGPPAAEREKLEMLRSLGCIQ